MTNNKNSTENQLYQESKFGFKDIVAMTIAAFQILAPVFIIIFAILTIVVIFITKVWLK